MRNRIDHWCTVETGKSQPSGAPFQWETRRSLVSHWNGGPSGWDFPVPTRHQWWILFISDMSLVLKKKTKKKKKKRIFCTCGNKATDQLCGNRTTDQRLCCRYMDSTIPILPKSEISSLSVAILCDCTALFVSDLVGKPRRPVFSERVSYYTVYMKINLSQDHLIYR